MLPVHGRRSPLDLLILFLPSTTFVCQLTLLKLLGSTRIRGVRGQTSEVSRARTCLKSN